MTKTPNTKEESPINARTFKDFDLNKYLLTALEKKGYDTPTEIQLKTLDAFSNGKHIAGQSQTGTGKTAAFLLPVLNALDTQKRAPQVLILAPTRELAHQIRDEVFELSKYMYMKSVCCYGGQSKRWQIEQLEKGPQVIIGTVGRVKDLIDMKKIRLSDINYFILDEVDRMLDMWFIDDIDYIWSRCLNIKQALTYSATMPHELKSLLSKYIGDDYTSIKIAPQKVVASKVDHVFMEVPAFKKYEALKWLLTENPEHKTIVFAETKRLVDDLAQQLIGDGFDAIALHGDMEQRDRFKTLKKIKNNDLRILVATDVAARWLNMNQIDLVVNFEVPNDPESYVHRIWRTARAGAEGKAVMLVSSGEYNALHSIEKRNKITLKKVDHEGKELVRSDQRRWGWWGRRKWRSRYRKPGSGGYRGNRWWWGSRGWSRGRSTSSRNSWSRSSGSYSGSRSRPSSSKSSSWTRTGGRRSASR